MSGYGNPKRISLDAPHGRDERSVGAVRGFGHRFRSIQSAEPWFFGRYDVTNDNRQTLPRFQPEAIRANYRIVEVLNAFGRTRGITPAQIALAWLMNKKPFIVPIPGTTKLSHLEENLRACDIRFTAEEIEELETAVAAIPVVGSRYDALQESKIPK